MAHWIDFGTIDLLFYLLTVHILWAVQYFNVFFHLDETKNIRKLGILDEMHNALPVFFFSFLCFASVIQNIKKFQAKNHFTNKYNFTDLEIPPWPLKYMSVIRIYTNLSNIPFLSISDNPQSKNDWSDVTQPWDILDFIDHIGRRSLEAFKKL